MALSANQTNELQALAGRALTAAKVTLATSLDAQIAGNAADNIRKITLG